MSKTVYYPGLIVMVNVAQLVEHQIVALVVVGSIPTVHPKNNQYALAYRNKTEYITYSFYQ
jgi:hypothetical protein